MSETVATYTYIQAYTRTHPDKDLPWACGGLDEVVVVFEDVDALEEDGLDGAVVCVCVCVRV